MLSLTLFSQLWAEQGPDSKRYQRMVSALEFVLKLESKELANRQLVKVEDELSASEGKIASSRKKQAALRKTIAEEALSRKNRVRLMKQIGVEEKLTKTLRKSFVEEDKLSPRKVSLAVAQAKKREKALLRTARKLVSQKSQQERWTWESVEKELRKSAKLPEKAKASTTERIQKLKEALAKAELSSKGSTSDYSKACKWMEMKARARAQLEILNARLDRKRRNVNRQHPATIDYLMDRNPQTQQVTGFNDRGNAWRIRCRLCEKLLRDYMKALQPKISFVKKYRSIFPREVEGTAEDYSTAQKLLKWLQKFDTITFEPPEIVTL